MTEHTFQYHTKHHESPFETFLRYTDEKQRSASKLAAILADRLPEHPRLLDIGTGNGEYLDLGLRGLTAAQGAYLTLLEPSDDLAGQLEARFGKHYPSAELQIVVDDLQHFEDASHYDVILMSHLFYHMPRADWAALLEKSLGLLKPTGALVIVLREKDDAYDFKLTFKPRLFPSFTKPLTIDDVLERLPGTGLSIDRQTSASTLKVPIDENLEDAISIIEFYLDKPWAEVPAAIQEEAMAFMRSRQGVLNQLDGIAVVSRPV